MLTRQTSVLLCILNLMFFQMILPTSKGAALYLVKAQLEEVADPVLLETQAVNEAVTYIEVGSSLNIYDTLLTILRTWCSGVH